VPITTEVAGSIPAYGEVYSIQHYILKLLKTRTHEFSYSRRAREHTTEVIINTFCLYK
jgi:hypothetical protein